jgi:cytoskeletal protein RodZ
MSTVAEQLRAARQAQNLTVQQVAEITKIRTDHLRALEEGRFEIFSAPVYVKGFTRTYSTLLKLDVPQIMAALDAELGQSKKFSGAGSFSQPSRGIVDFIMLHLSKVDWQKSLAVLAVLVVVGAAVSGVLIWRHQRAKDPLKGLKPGIYQAPSNSSGETLPLPGSAPKR